MQPLTGSLVFEAEAEALNVARPSTAIEKSRIRFIKRPSCVNKAGEDMNNLRVQRDLFPANSAKRLDMIEPQATRRKCGAFVISRL